MSVYHHIREALGLNQQDLADYLSVSKSQLAMAEINQRPLPTAASLKLVRLEQYIINYAAMPVPVGPLSAEMREQLLAEAQKQELKAIQATRKRAELQQQYNQCRMLQQVCADLMGLPADEQQEKAIADRLWLEARRQDAQVKEKDCNTSAQALWELKAEVATYHAMQARAKAEE